MLNRPRFKWSVDDYEKMIKHGILTENHKVELIRGEIVPKMPIGDPHSACVKRLNRFFGKTVADLAILSVQDPIRLSDSEPEPDFALLEFRVDLYGNGKPKPAEILLLVEVSDSSLQFDREVKGSLYAENGISEYWIVNLVDRCVEVHRDPRPDGTYAEVRSLKPGETIALRLLPTVSIAIAEIMP